MATRLEAPGLRSAKPGQLADVLAPGALVGLPLALVLLQPDLGTAMAFVGILMAVLFWAGIPLTYLFLLVSPGIALLVSFNTWLFSGYMVALVGLLYLRRSRLYTFEHVAVLVFNLAVGTVARLLWDSLAPYQQNRVLVFLDPSLDPREAGYHLIQSKVAIGSGGLTGKGFTLGTQKRFDFLPEQHTDFIFAVIGDEFGFVGTLLVLGAFAYVLVRLIRMATATGSHFAGFVPLRYLRRLDHACLRKHRDDGRARPGDRNPPSVPQLRRVVSADVLGRRGRLPCGLPGRTEAFGHRATDRENADESKPWPGSTSPRSGCAPRIGGTFQRCVQEVSGLRRHRLPRETRPESLRVSGVRLSLQVRRLGLICAC